MYPKDKKTAALMSETIRDVLTNKALLESIVEQAKDGGDTVPPFLEALDEKTGIAAMVTAQMLKAIGGDTAAFTALSKYGFGEKVQVDVSDFYSTDKFEIEVVKTIDPGEIHETIEGTVEEEPRSNERLEQGPVEKVKGSTESKDDK